ncbi:MAG: hypothetical protein AAF657_02325 [Acidobacteriota bacterium]
MRKSSHVLMLPPLVVLAASSIFAVSSAALELFGYTGIDDTTARGELTAHGIAANLASLAFEEHNWQTLDTAEILADYHRNGLRAAILVEGFLFAPEIVPGSPCDWLDVDGDGTGDPFGYRLHDDWRDRLKSWRLRNRHFLVPEKIAILILQTEVNNKCTDPQEILRLARTAKRRFPGLSTAIGWGRTHVDADPQAPFARPAPEMIPAEVDILGMWSYGIYDPADPLHPLNANADFFDPAFPENPATDYGYLLSKLQPHQSVVLVFDAHYQAWDHGVHQTLGWSYDDLAALALNYETFAVDRSEVVGLLGFHWRNTGPSLGLRDLLPASAALGNAHREIACRTSSGC